MEQSKEHMEIAKKWEKASAYFDEKFLKMSEEKNPVIEDRQEFSDLLNKNIR